MQRGGTLSEAKGSRKGVRTLWGRTSRASNIWDINKQNIINKNILTYLCIQHMLKQTCKVQLFIGKSDAGVCQFFRLYAVSSFKT